MFTKWKFRKSEKPNNYEITLDAQRARQLGEELIYLANEAEDHDSFMHADIRNVTGSFEFGKTPPEIVNVHLRIDPDPIESD